jgi:hypothetical protein
MVRSYQIYWIEKEFASFFYGRERLFFNLFLQRQSSNGWLKEILDKQVDFITKPIPYLPIQRYVGQEVQRREDILKVEESYIIELPDGSGGVKMNIQKDYIKIDAWGLEEIETLFFEILRKVDGRLLAIELEHERFGWLKPIKERKYV